LFLICILAKHKNGKLANGYYFHLKVSDLLAIVTSFQFSLTRTGSPWPLSFLKEQNWKRFFKLF